MRKSETLRGYIICAPFASILPGLTEILAYFFWSSLHQNSLLNLKHMSLSQVDFSSRSTWSIVCFVRFLIFPAVSYQSTSKNGSSSSNGNVASPTETKNTWPQFVGKKSSILGWRHIPIGGRQVLMFWVFHPKNAVARASWHAYARPHVHKRTSHLSWIWSFG